MRPARPDRRKGEMAMIIVSTIVSAITAKIVATYYFKKVDGYVKEMCEMTIKRVFVRHIFSFFLMY